MDAHTRATGLWPFSRSTMVEVLAGEGAET